MNQQNWRVETGALDYFGHQKKQLQVADRRPVIRKPSDLVGPGISSSAVRITDFNNLLATFDGYYSAEAGATNAPTADQAYVGITTMDAELGGTQVLYGLTDGGVYRRIFTRNPADASAIYWGAWMADSANTDDADWHVIGATDEPAFQNGWINYPAPHAVAAFIRVGGSVRLKGLIRNGTVGVVPAFTLPVGYRPFEQLVFGSLSNNAVGRVDVTAAGEVWVNVPSTNTWVTLSHISFKAEQ